MIKLITNLFKSNSDARKITLKRTKQKVVQNPLGRLPMWVPKINKDRNPRHVVKINRYLAYQEGRLERLKAKKKFKKLIFLWCIILKNSKSYQIVLFNKVQKQWWVKLTMGEAIRSLKDCCNKARKWDLELTLKRFYLDKGMEKTGVPNGKLRPIGSPTINSRLICKGINDLIYYAFEERLEKFQHGFRRERGTHTALFSIWKEIWVFNKKFIYEFDFKSYFNRVRPEWIHTYLRIRSLDLANTVINMLSGIRYVFDMDPRNIPEEEEIKFIGLSNYRGVVKPRLLRKGVPQGLSLSPILATLVLELFKPPEGLNMYADDGIFITPYETSAYKHWLYQIRTMGIHIAPEKSGIVKDSFKFLGVTFSLEEQTATFKNSTICWKDLDTQLESTQNSMRDWFTTVPQLYGKKPDNWFWEVKKNSFAEQFKNKQNWLDWLLTVLIGLWSCAPYKGYRYFYSSGTYSVSGLSTQCSESLATYLSGMRLAKLRGLHFELAKTKKWVHINKKMYVESNDWIKRLSIHEGVYLSKIMGPKSALTAPSVNAPKKEVEEKIIFVEKKITPVNWTTTDKNDFENNLRQWEKNQIERKVCKLDYETKDKIATVNGLRIIRKMTNQYKYRGGTLKPFNSIKLLNDLNFNFEVKNWEYLKIIITHD